MYSELEGQERLSAKASSASLKRKYFVLSFQRYTTRPLDTFCSAKHREFQPLKQPRKKTYPWDKSFFVEGQERLELSTPCLRGRCSNQLSYWPATANDYSKIFYLCKYRVISDTMIHCCAPVAQWIRALVFGTRCRKFESCRVYHEK